jgi:hypothetical protein
MWANGLLDWMILGSGYVLALVVFSLLGGVPRAGEAFQRWGKRTTSRGTRQTPAP